MKLKAAAGRRFHWVRHAPSGEGGGFCGHSDPRITLPPLATIAAVAARLPDAAVWYTSPLRRARQTAEALMACAGAQGRCLLEDARFSEQDFGAWEGRRYESLAALRRPSDWRRAECLRPPCGESFLDLTRRVRAAIGELVRRHHGREVVIVAHAGVLRAALACALAFAPARALGFQPPPLALWSLIHRAGA